MNNNNNGGNNMPQQPTQSQIQRQSIQRDMDKQGNSGGGTNIIGKHNYSYDAQTPNQKGITAKLRRKVKPLMRWWRQVHYRMEESSRKRKRMVVAVFLCVLAFSFVYGHRDKLGIAVANSGVGTVRQFVNNDAMKMTSEKYDKKNQSIQANFVSASPSGAITPKNLSASFVFAEMPSKSGLKRPTMNLIPTFNNHYTVIIHHVYPGFGGVEISFHDNSRMSVGTLNSMAKESDGNSFLSASMNKEIQQIAENGGSVKDTEKVNKLLDRLQSEDISNFVIGERNISKGHQGFIDPTASPRMLALHDLHRHLNSDNSNIKGDQILIKREKARVKSDQNKVREINRGADTGSKQKELSATAQEVHDIAGDVNNYEQKIKTIKQDVRLTLSRIQRVENDISTLPKTKAPKPIGAFSNSAH